MRLSTCKMLLALACAAISEASYGEQDSSNWYTDPDVPLVVVGNVYSSLHGKRALCEKEAPESIAQIERGVAKFRADFPQLIKLAEESRFWDEARESSRRFNSRLLDRAAKGARQQLIDVCKDNTDYLFGGEPEGKSELAQRWMRILRHWSAPPF